MPEPLRVVGEWRRLSPESYSTLMRRGLDHIFDASLRDTVLEIIEDVRVAGDEAIARALRTFDGCDVEPGGLRVSEEEFARARADADPRLVRAIKDSIERVKRFNEWIIERAGWWRECAPGLMVGEVVTPIESAGLFVPSGKGSYPSVLIQIGTPAVVAEVPRIAVVVPPLAGSHGEVDPAVLIVADELGLREVFRANGPAGIAALAFGTATVPRVLKVVGPGGPPVTCAQLEVQRFGTVSHLLLGPSESLVIADDTADPVLLAADLLNEAEHGPDSSSFLVTDSRRLLGLTQAEVARQLAELPEPRRSYAARALGRNGGAILVRDLDEAAEVANALAPEHMQVVTADPGKLLPLLRNAGENLLGPWTPISAANFAIGCPAALPTSGYAKVCGGVNADVFRKRTAIAQADEQALIRMAPTIAALAGHEGFPAHAASALRRLRGPER
ncbi:histidinol dehydrogenase [Nonomuraea sp. JJY05]|uniref:histidinol dehydrogenase n=1 Tax=Nonomuraea sp. JJY05 TaxID=3350255 RepID=UPI00373E34A6